MPIVKPGTGRLIVTGHAPDVRVIANLAWQHLYAATIFRDRVATLEREHLGESLGPYYLDIRAHTSACIMSSAASLEALINEFFLAPNCKLRPLLHDDFDQKFWGTEAKNGRDGIERKQVLVKYQEALRLLGLLRLDKQSPTFKDAEDLIDLRNALVHHKPTWDSPRGRKGPLVEALEGRFALSPFVDDGADFVSMKCMSAGCAQWAVATTLAFMRQFDERANLDAQKMAGFWELESRGVKSDLRPPQGGTANDPSSGEVY